jgi:predicted RNA-binding protein with PUA-like domain
MPAAMAFWLIKSEPSTYSWDQLVADRRTEWDGIRNHEARNNLSAMKRGDLCLFYHSGKREVVGVARVAREAHPDPTTDDERWVAVDVTPRRRLPRPVPLAALRSDRRTSGMALIRRGRLSVTPVTDSEFAAVLELGGAARG